MVWTKQLVFCLAVDLEYRIYNFYTLYSPVAQDKSPLRDNKVYLILLRFAF